MFSNPYVSNLLNVIYREGTPEYKLGVCAHCNTGR